MTPRKFIEECFLIFQILSSIKRSDYYIERLFLFGNDTLQIIFDMEEIDNYYYSSLDLRFYINKSSCFFNIDPSERKKQNIYSILFEKEKYNCREIYHRKTTKKYEIFKYANEILKYYPDITFFTSDNLNEMFASLKLEII